METIKKTDMNRDPLTGEPGSHPVGVSVGTAAGAAAGIGVAAATGAAAGSMAGPAGAVAGAIIGGAVGAAFGKDIAEEINPTAEETYWSENYKNRPYVSSTDTYDTYRPAYRHGVDSFSRYEGKSFNSVEPSIRSDWEKTQTNATLPWDRAREATKDSYTRLSTRYKDRLGSSDASSTSAYEHKYGTDKKAS